MTQVCTAPFPCFYVVASLVWSPAYIGFVGQILSAVVFIIIIIILKTDLSADLFL